MNIRLAGFGVSCDRINMLRRGRVKSGGGEARKRDDDEDDCWWWKPPAGKDANRAAVAAGLVLHMTELAVETRLRATRRRTIGNGDNEEDNIVPKELTRN